MNKLQSKPRKKINGPLLAAIRRLQMPTFEQEMPDQGQKPPEYLHWDGRRFRVIAHLENGMVRLKVGLHDDQTRDVPESEMYETSADLGTRPPEYLESSKSFAHSD